MRKRQATAVPVVPVCSGHRQRRGAVPQSRFAASGRAGHGGGRSGGGGGAAGAVGAPAVEKRCAMVGESRAYDHRGIAEKPPLAFEEGAFPFGELWGFEFRPRGACRAYLVRNGLLNAVGVRGCRAQVASSQLASPESEVLSSELS